MGIKLNSSDIEIAVARMFNPRMNIIVPNVFWGLGLNYECDLLIVSQGHYATEVEIKVSVSDIKADLKKRWNAHRSDKIRRFYYAVPDYLKDCESLPVDCGLITVDENLRCKTVRPPRLTKHARKLSDNEVNKILHLGCMRIWSLKEVINSRRHK